MKKKLPFVLLFVLLCIAVAIGVYRHFSTKTRFNESYVNGNTAGNLYNSGRFCENGGQIFFANPDDENRLYVMNPDGSDLKKLSDDNATYINADNNYVYYTRNNASEDTAFSFLSINTNSLCRIDRANGKNSMIMDREPSIYASLVGDYIYYLRYTKETATNLYKIRIDGSEQKEVNRNAYYTCSTDGQYIYYNGRESDHNIRRLDTASDSESTLLSANCWMPTVVEGTTAYYMDCDHDYALARADLSTGEQVLLTEDRIDTYNVSGEYIYFQRSGSDPALCRIRTDGSDYTVIASGIYNTINVTSSYVYFTEYYTGEVLRTPTDAPGSVEGFHPGKAD